ncbi:hypothetical protein HDU81_003362 [Chytriomyces hyalinus]|nr:hypothetical protein HDU81_003362 [Chytriomyces hyalinus]
MAADTPLRQRQMNLKKLLTRIITALFFLLHTMLILLIHLNNVNNFKWLTGSLTLYPGEQRFVALDAVRGQLCGLWTLAFLYSHPPWSVTVRTVYERELRHTDKNRTRVYPVQHMSATSAYPELDAFYAYSLPRGSVMTFQGQFQGEDSEDSQVLILNHWAGRLAMRHQEFGSDGIIQRIPVGPALHKPQTYAFPQKQNKRAGIQYSISINITSLVFDIPDSESAPFDLATCGFCRMHMNPAMTGILIEAGLSNVSTRTRSLPIRIQYKPARNIVAVLLMGIGFWCALDRILAIFEKAWNVGYAQLVESDLEGGLTESKDGLSTRSKHLAAFSTNASPRFRTTLYSIAYILFGIVVPGYASLRVLDQVHSSPSRVTFPVSNPFLVFLLRWSLAFSIYAILPALCAMNTLVLAFMMFKCMMKPIKAVLTASTASKNVHKQQDGLAKVMLEVEPSERMLEDPDALPMKQTLALHDRHNMRNRAHALS